MLEDRPNDKVFDEAKPAVEDILIRLTDKKAALVELIKTDMLNDLALAEAMDEAGKVLEYLIQEKEADRPFFDGSKIIADFARVSKLKTTYEYAKILGLEEEALSQVLTAEVSRLWFDPRKRGTHEKGSDQATTVKFPDEVVNLLKSISKAIGKK